ncbi:MAG: aminopeptidase P family protein [Clostridia bacterium]|nr:aminopeptidase P family protein [Clostridia bacterium]
MRNCFLYQKKLHDTLGKELRIGITEKEIADIISSFGAVWQGDIVSGIRSANIEGEATERIIKDGDSLIIDIQFFDGVMWSDITRTYFFGNLKEMAAELYQKTEKSLKNAEKLLKNGTKCADLYDFLQKEINSPYSFKHHAGHLIGDKPLIKPQFLPDSEESLKTGMAVTLEPGVYVPEKFGIRIENNYLITENGFETLFDYTQDIKDFIITR